MKNMSELVQGRLELFATTKGPNSKRAYWIEQICTDILTKKDFKKVLGQTKQMTRGEIEEIYLQAKSWRVNPPALLWKLIKEKNQEIKKQLTIKDFTNGKA